MLKATVQVVEGKVASLSLTGDFFLHPEECINLLEEGVVGVNFDEKSLSERVIALKNTLNLTFFGFDVENLVTVILQAGGAV